MADNAAVGAVANETRVEMHLLPAGVDHLAAFPSRVVPLLQRASREGIGRVPARLVDEDERVGCKPYAGEIESFLPRNQVMRIECRHEVIEALRRCGDGRFVARHAQPPCGQRISSCTTGKSPVCSRAKSEKRAGAVELGGTA